MEFPIKQALQQGVAAHREGKLEDAERFYRTIIESQPLHPDANHSLGILAVSVNQIAEAIAVFKTALKNSHLDNKESHDLLSTSRICGPQHNSLKLFIIRA